MVVVVGGGEEEVVVIEEEEVGRTGGMMAVESLDVGAGREVVGDVPSFTPIFLKVSTYPYPAVLTGQPRKDDPREKEGGKEKEEQEGPTPNTSTHETRQTTPPSQLRRTP